MKNIEGFEKYSIDEWGTVWNTESGHILCSFIDGIHGVRKVALFKDGKEYKKLVHRLVAIAFLGIKGTIVLHKDGDKLNNHYTNLYWSKRLSPSQRKMIA